MLLRKEESSRDPLPAGDVGRGVVALNNQIYPH